MSAFLAVVCFSAVRVVAAGYTGSWFLPVIGGEVLGASFVFLAIAVVEAVLARLRRRGHDGVDGPMNAVVYVALFVAFGKGWVEPHVVLSQALAIGAGPSPALLIVGLVAALATRPFTGRVAADALVWVTAGWLIIGPQIYARFDSVESGERALALLLIGLASALIAAAVARLGARLGARGLRIAMAAAAVAPLAVGALSRGPVDLDERVDVATMAERPSVLLVVVDTLRADALDRRSGSGAYLMPELRRLADEGVRFDQAVAPAPWTLPSTLTLLSGLNPHRHRAGLLGGRAGQRRQAGAATQMPVPGEASAAYLGSTLRGAGYQVAAFVNNPYLRPYFGFGHGFLRFRRYRGNAHDATAIVLSWIARHQTRPLFTVLHLMDPHWPYHAPGAYGDPRRSCSDCDDLASLQYRMTDQPTRDEVRRRYDAEVAFTDAEIGRLWNALRTRGLADDTWLIVTADHGEEFWEHGRFLHGHSLYDELLRVPLIVVAPATAHGFARAARVTAQVQLEDVVPTLLELAAIEPPLALDGVSLVPYLRGASGRGLRPRPAVAGFIQEQGNFSWAVRTPRYKLIVNPQHIFPTFFDLSQDPGETTSVLSDNPRPAFFMRKVPSNRGLAVGKELAAALDAPAAARGADGDLRRELRSLGYVD